MSLAERKAAARKSAFARRKKAHAIACGAAGHLSAVLAGHRGVPLAGYMPMRTEIDPLPAMAEASAYGPVGVPVIMAKDSPLQFRDWSPEAEMEEGAFGAQIPTGGGWMTPEILIVPLVAFNWQGGRLGYGGGFYDRTIELLRRTGPVLAIGFAYSAQEDSALPLEPTDQPLDMIVTEQGVLSL